VRRQLGFHELNCRNQLVLDPLETFKQRMRSMLHGTDVRQLETQEPTTETETHQEPGGADKVDGNPERFRSSRRTQMRKAVHGVPAADPNLTRLEFVHMVRNT
jgi:hypothetical protein